jgi:Tol biopolymer transport system component
MGEVWRGRDTRLDRSVAVKILPATFAQDEDRRARFEREAKTISSLNHPHICTLFDVGRAGETHFLVMELLEGEALVDRLRKGSLPLEQVLKFGAQVSDALDAAHRQGIVHRDLKPGNVVLTKSGAKLLDFGLARTSTGLGGVSGSTELPTEARPLTAAGTVLGTFQYMAPEQLEGAEADARTDIFALGALLYEMVTGKRAFEGKSKTSLIAAILSQQPPPISQVAPVMPPALDHVVRKCLEKDPDDRWQSARDVASELRWIAEAGSQAGVPARLALRRKSRERVAWVIAAGSAAAAILGFAWAIRLRGTAREAERPFYSEIALPPDVPLAGVTLGAMAFSPDGRRLALVIAQPTPGLAVRDLSSGETKRLPGTDGASFPFWSPDSRSLAFFAEGRLKKVEANGGPVQVVCDANAGRGGSWGRDGTIVFAPDIAGPLMKVHEAGGAPTAATRPADPNASHRNPWFLPDGRHFLLTSRARGTEATGSIAVASLDAGDARALVERGSNPQYADGFLFYVVDGNLVAQPFDAGRLSLQPQRIPLADAVEHYNPRDLAQFSVAPAGVLGYRRLRLRRSRVVWLDREGRELATVGEPYHHQGSLEFGMGLSLGADGRTLLATRSDASGGNADVWAVDLASAQMTRSTFVSSPGNTRGVLSPDGARMAVSSAATGGWSTLWIQSTSGSGSRQTLLEKASFSVMGWSPDGSTLVGDTQQPETGFDVAYVAIADPSKLLMLTSSRFDERSAALSPNGRWIAYQSNETGRNEVFVSDFSAASRKWQVSRAGGRGPTWRRDGLELYFTDAEARTMAAPLREHAGSLEVLAPIRLSFPPDVLLARGVSSQDGKRFLAARLEPETFTEPIRLIRGWRQLVGK